MKNIDVTINTDIKNVSEEKGQSCANKSDESAELSFSCKELDSNQKVIDSKCQSLPDCHKETVNIQSKLLNENCENTSNRFNTWPEKNTTIKNSSEMITSETNCDSENDIFITNKKIFNAVSLNTALESCQLTYSPITKQLLQVNSPTGIINDHGDVTKECSAPNKTIAGDAASTKSEEKTVDANSTSVRPQKTVGGTNETGHRRTLDAGSFSSTVSSLSDATPSTSSSLWDSEDRVSTTSLLDCKLNDNDTTNDLKSKKKGISNFFSRNVFSSNGWKLFSKNLATEVAPSAQDIVASSSALIQHIRPSTLPAKNSEEEKRHRDEYLAILEAARKKEEQLTRDRRRKYERQLKHEEQLAAAAKYWSIKVLPAWESQCGARKTRDLWWQGLPPSVRGRVWLLALGNDLNITPQLYDICVQRAHERLNHSDSYHAKTHLKCSCSESRLNINEESQQLNGIESQSDRTESTLYKNEQGTNDKRSQLTNVESDETVNCKHTSNLRTCGNSMPRNLSLPAFGVNHHDHESSMELIQLDISRTFPNLGIFQEGGPYFSILHELLAAYVCYRPDVGYVQGMSFIAAVLILNMEPPDAFTCFANILNRPLHLAAFTLNQRQMNAYYLAYDQVFKENLPKLYGHFEESSLTPDLYLLDWVYTVYAKAMPLDVACRVWDIFLRDGDEFIFRTALGVLHLYQDVLLEMDFLQGAQFLTRLPDGISTDKLFQSIESICMMIGKRSFSDIVDVCKDSVSNLS